MSKLVDMPVVCGACRSCCRSNTLVLIVPGEDAPFETFETDVVDLNTLKTDLKNHFQDGQARALKRKPNGDCVYLDAATGCTIYERRPAMCRAFNCVEHLLSDGPKLTMENIKTGHLSHDVMQAAVSRMPPGTVEPFMDGIIVEARKLGFKG
jgi:Fe-S-cluster containining protein